MTADQEHFDCVDDIFERMKQDGRSRHVKQDLLEVQTKDGLAEARELVNDAIASKFVTAAELARRTGIKPSAISAFRNSKWKGSAGTEATTASMLCKGLDQLKKQRVAEETSVSGFVSITVAEAIYSVVRYAIKRRMMTAFVIGAGNGKSLALTHIQQDTPGAVLVTARQNRRRPRSFLQIWCRELRLAESGRSEDLQDRVIARLAGSDRLSLIDECHKLPVVTLDVIREVWDATRTPMVLSGTPSFLQILTTRRVGENASELMDQLYSRIGIVHKLDELSDPDSGEPTYIHTREDIRKVFERQHVRLVKSGVDFLFKLANTPAMGGLRTCRDLVQLMVDLYPREPVNAEHLKSALVSKIGPREAGFRMDRADIASEGYAKQASG